MKYSIVFEKCNDGGYIAHVSNLPLCFSGGNTLSEVKENIKEAIELYLEEIKDGNCAVKFSSFPQSFHLKPNNFSPNISFKNT